MPLTDIYLTIELVVMVGRGLATLVAKRQALKLLEITSSAGFIVVWAGQRVENVHVIYVIHVSCIRHVLKKLMNYTVYVLCDDG